MNEAQEDEQSDIDVVSGVDFLCSSAMPHIYDSSLHSFVPEDDDLVEAQGNDTLHSEMKVVTSSNQTLSVQQACADPLLGDTI